MVADIEALMALLDGWGVPYERREDSHTVDIVVGDNGRNDKVVGYMGFYTAFTFDEAGKFKQMGAWE